MDNITRRDAEMAYITDEAIIEQQRKTKILVQAFNTTDKSDYEKLKEIANQLVKGTKKDMIIVPPFYCEYEDHIEIGDYFFANCNCIIIDVAKVKIGNHVMFGPSVSIYTAGHPIHPVSRMSGYEYGIAVEIGNNVWVGGNTVVCPGVHIGDNAVIGAGSVVTKDIPGNVIAAGNPCRIIREITEEDKKYYYKDREFDEEAWNAITGEDNAE